MVVGYENYLNLLIVTFLICAFVPAWVFGLLFLQVINVGYRGVCQLDSDSEWMEFVWTGVPCTAVSIMCLANTVCLVESDIVYGSYGINVIARQWYWSYQDHVYGGYYDSIMNDFVGDVDKPLRVWNGIPVMLCATSADVIHAMALPEFNFKADIMPGRLSYHTLVPDECGIAVGYCSELCGAGHAYMPMVVEIVERGLNPIRFSGV